MGVSQPRGVRDFNPSEAIALNEVTDIIEEIFKRFGFYPINTPVIENMDVLTAKSYGEEAAKQIYKIEGEESGMRFDFTVPMARYVAMNKSMPLPFKRYQIGQIWRKDEPQKMRYREFLQADVDIVGSKEAISDAEAIAAPAMALDGVGVEGYKILLNSRVFLNGVLSMFGVPEWKHVQTIRIVDKLDKIGVDEVEEQLGTIGMSKESSEGIVEFITQEGSNEEKLELLSAKAKGVAEEIKRTKEILSLLEKYKFKGEVVVDFSLARGLDYYTSGIWEFVTYEGGKRLPTIAAGGRYDNLIGIYSKEQVPATGTSIGISRIIDIIGVGDDRKTYAKVYVANIGDTSEYALYIANTLRSKGIYADLNTTKRNVSKQLEYANSLNFKYVIIVGDEEEKRLKVKLRDMIKGEEEMLNVDDAVEVVKR